MSQVIDWYACSRTIRESCKSTGNSRANVIARKKGHPGTRKSAIAKFVSDTVQAI
jgi:hypothetical protein